MDYRKKGKKAKESSNGQSESTPESSDLSKKLCQQSKLLWKTVDTLKRLDMKKGELIAILDANDQAIPTGIDKASLF